MSIKNLIFAGILYLALAVFSSSRVLAITPPSFPSCLNPQGEIKAHYDSGVHGIPGRSNEYRGSDTVLKLSDETLSQCLCTENGEGIQTNWWKASSLSDSDIAVLKNLGWIYIPSGSVWGLEDTRYMAFNSTYACRGGQGGVLGLATTGNIIFLYGLLTLGSISLLLGLWLRKSRRQTS